MHCWCDIGVSVCLLNRLERWCISRTRHYGTTNHPLVPTFTHFAHISLRARAVAVAVSSCTCQASKGWTLIRVRPQDTVWSAKRRMTHNCSSQYILFPRSSQCFTTQPTSRWRRIATVAHLATTFRHAASHLQASLCFEVNPFKI